MRIKVQCRGLRYDPEPPPLRPLDVVHDGKATRLDAYANTAVRRTYPAKEIEADDPPPFEIPAETDELIESSARRGAEARLGHLIGLRGIGLLTRMTCLIS